MDKVIEIVFTKRLRKAELMNYTDDIIQIGPKCNMFNKYNR